MKPLTKPMSVVLYDCATRDSATLPSPMLYPGGQMRWIRAGLVERGLLDPDTYRLTPEGMRIAWEIAGKTQTDLDGFRREWAETQT